MLDAIFAFKGQLYDRPVPKSYRAEQAITDARMRHSAGGSKRLTVIFAPWHISDQLIGQLERKYLAQQSDVLLYNFSPYILSHDATLVRDSFEYIAETISRQVNDLQTKHPYETVNLVGYSLGNVMLSMAAVKILKFDTVTMVVPGSDLLNSLWYGRRTSQIKKSLLSHGSSYQQLSQVWSLLAPIAHIEALRGHQIHIILSKRDSYIPYRFGQRLVDKLTEQGVPVTVTISRYFGHIATSYQHIKRRT